MKTNPNDSINPTETIDKWICASGKIPKPIKKLNVGLTKREYFAAIAMQGMLSSLTLDQIEQRFHHEIVMDSVRHAKALIEELNKEIDETEKQQ